MDGIDGEAMSFLENGVDGEAMPQCCAV